MQILINGYELLETHGDGSSESSVAYVEHETDAQQWVVQSKGWRRYVRVHKLFIVHESLESLYAHQKAAVKERALAKLSKEEREALGF